MKLTKTIVGLLAATSTFAAAAVTYSGNALSNLQGSVVGDLPSGRLGLLIADTGNDGFGALTGLTSTNANLALGTTFGGDLILSRISSSVGAGDAKLSGSFTWTATLCPVNTRWAVVWFETLTAAGAETNAANGTKYGMASATDWSTPAVDPTGTPPTVTYSTSPTGTMIRTLALNNGGTALGLPAGAQFATNGTTLSVIPEPSAALLGALGALGLLRRRRI